MSEDKQYTREELEEKLTNKEKAFCDSYVVDWNASRAAKDAGYSEKTAYEIGSQNLKKLHIKQYIEFIKNDLERLSGVSKLKNLQELAKLAFSTIANLHDTWISLKEFEVLTEAQKACIESIDTKTERKVINKEAIEVQYVKLKLYSKTTAIDMINKMMGYNSPEKHEVDGQQTVIILPNNGRD